jgi:uncharacterized protein YdeI (YjbR/CyaY-like superfamily)
MAKNLAALPLIYAESRAAWRKWLAENHATAQGVQLVFYKKGSGKASVQYTEAVKEALCFGWIDSKVNSLDAARYKQVFTPRNPKSVWSKLNKQYLEELMSQDLMTEAGLKCVAIAKQNGSWTSIDALENLEIPTDLQQALDSNPAAKANYEAFGRTNKKDILSWVNVKNIELRQKRITETVALAERNIPNNYSERRKKK